ncbi:MAG: aspartyl protease [Bacteroidota bacterium]|nr:aspartyl protease [Bacteroidota bacterium]
MGITEKTFRIKKNLKTSEYEDVNFMIDSGAVFSLVPGEILRKLGIKPHRKVIFSLAEMSKIERWVGDAFFEYEGEGGTAPVIFGEKDEKPLLGATVLESLRLVLNPYKRELYHMGIIPL